MPDLTRDQRSVGFPSNHPPMHSLLAVPVVSGGRVLGNLYVAEKHGGVEFSDEDEVALVRYATQAALAIQNARLHRRVSDLAIAEERERIAREMHDSLAQVLGYVNTKTQAVQELLRQGQTERASAQVGQLGEAARAAYADVREGILALRTTLGPERGLLEALQEYLHLWREQSGIEAELGVQPVGASLHRLPPAAELQLLRIVQEALANVRKHAGARHAVVRISVEPGAVETVISDDGAGFDQARAHLADDRSPRFGLSTMRERAESAGGTLEIVSMPGQGTRIAVRIPTHPASGFEHPLR